MIQQVFQNMAAGIERVLAQENLETVARKKYALEVARFGMRLYSGEHTLAWCGVAAPFDLLHAMGVTSCFVEFIGAVLASTGGIEAALEAAEQNGFSTDLCSYHRAVNGAAALGWIPAADFFIATTCPCSGGLSTVEELARRFKKALFVLHIPAKDNPQAKAFLVQQLKQMVAFVEQQTGRPLDQARLRDTVQKTNETRKLLLALYQLASHVPTPAKRNDMINFGFIMSLLMGTDAGVRLAKAYHDEFVNKIERLQSGIRQEQIRLLWFQNRVQFKTELEKLLEEEFHAAVVVDELNSITWEPINPDAALEGIAERILGNPLAAPLGRRLSNLVRIARQYRVDGIIHPGHWGCRQGTGARGLIEAAMKKERLPMLNLDVDCADPRNFSEGQLRTRLGAFIETLAARKAGRKA